MKKIFLPLLVLIILTYSGCENQINRTFDGNIIGKHTVLYDNNQFLINVSENEIIVSIDNGNYKGLSYKFTNKGYEVIYDSLVCKSDILYISENSLIATIAESFKDMISSKNYIGLSEYSPYLSGTCESGGYKVILNPNDGNITSITFTGLNIEIQFLYL